IAGIARDADAGGSDISRLQRIGNDVSRCIAEPENARLQGWCPNHKIEDRGAVQPAALVIHEEKQLVLEDRAAGRESEAVVERMRSLQVIEIVCPTVGIEAGVVVILISAAVPRVGPALGDQRHLTSQRAPEGRVGIRSSHLEFLRALEWNRHDWRGIWLARRRGVAVAALEITGDIAAIESKRDLFQSCSLNLSRRGYAWLVEHERAGARL